MTRSSSRAAARGGSPKAAESVKIAAAAAAANYQPLDAQYPGLSGHQVFFVVDTVFRPLISLRRVMVVPAPRETKLTHTPMCQTCHQSVKRKKPM